LFDPWVMTVARSIPRVLMLVERLCCELAHGGPYHQSKKPGANCFFDGESLVRWVAVAGFPQPSIQQHKNTALRQYSAAAPCLIFA